MLALLALATTTVAYYDGPRGYCSPFTARYLTLIDDVLVFHGGHGAKKFRYRSLDQPVCGLLRREGRTTLYVQREVAGIYSPTQDCCNKPVTRLEAVDVSRWIN
jgi:hypothetical protein